MRNPPREARPFRATPPGSSTARFKQFLLITAGAFCLPALAAPAPCRPAAETEIISAVAAHADNLIEHARDRYGCRHTPLFVDRLNTETLEPVQKISRFSSQQDLLRLLVGLTEITGDERYRAAAAAALRHMISHFRSPSGLFYWGGYVFIDLVEGEHRATRNAHSLRGYYPFYEFFWEVDPEAAVQFLRAFWNAQVVDWENLEFCRAGGLASNWNREMGPLWNSEYGRPEPFIKTRGTLSFIGPGTDLIYAAGLLYELTGERGAWIWGERLAEQYVRARHPETGLGVYIYNKLEPTRKLPEDPAEADRVPGLTAYGDRAENQFGRTGSSDPDHPFYNPVKDKIAHDGMLVAREGWLITTGRSIYVNSALAKLNIAERLGEDGEQLMQWTIDGMKNFIRMAYDRENNLLRPIWADGTDMTGLRIPVTGYFGRRGNTFAPSPADHGFLFSYARAWRLSGDDEIWAFVRSVAEAIGLGDLGEKPGSGTSLNLGTERACAHTIFALLEIIRGTADSGPYLQLAGRIGENLMEERFINGFFVSADRNMIAVNSPEPLALLALEAERLGRADTFPSYPSIVPAVHRILHLR